MRLDRSTTLLAVIDVQEKLAAVISEREAVEKNIERLIRGCHVLGIPLLITEQYPQGIGTTTPAVRAALDATTTTARPIQKMCFSAFGSPEFVSQLDFLGRRQILLAGIEAHVCVYQTAMDLLTNRYEVYVVADAVSSRAAQNKQLALDRLRLEGVRLTSTEMALFELTECAGTDEFRAISKLVK